MLAIPVIATIFNALSLTIDKVVLAKKRMPVGLFLSLGFLFIFFVTALLTPHFGAIDYSLVFQLRYVVLFITMIVLAITWNYLAAVSVQKEKLHEHEMIVMLTPVITIILASIYSPTRVDSKVLIAAVLAGVFLLFAKMEKGHFDFNKYSINLLVAVFLMAAESLIITELLAVYSPVSLYAFRTGFIFIFYALIFRPHFHLASRDNFKLVAFSSILGAVYMILKFYAYKDFGLVRTTLFLIASPILVYFICAKYFKEKINWKTVISSVVILGCIAYVTYIDALSH